MTELSVPRSRRVELRRAIGFNEDEVDPAAPLFLVSFHQCGVQKRFASTGGKKPRHDSQYIQSTAVSEAHEPKSSAAPVERFHAAASSVTERTAAHGDVSAFSSAETRVSPVLERDGPSSVEQHHVPAHAVDAHLAKDDPKNVESHHQPVSAVSADLEKNRPRGVEAHHEPQRGISADLEKNHPHDVEVFVDGTTKQK